MACVRAPFTAMGRAVGPDVDAVGGNCIAGPSGLGQPSQHRLLEVALQPEAEAVVDRGMGVVGGGAIAPAAARRLNTQVAGDDLPDVLRLWSGLILGYLVQSRHGKASLLT